MYEEVKTGDVKNNDDNTATTEIKLPTEDGDDTVQMFRVEIATNERYWNQFNK